jgi:hypothetical protein
VWQFTDVSEVLAAFTIKAKSNILKDGHFYIRFGEELKHHSFKCADADLSNFILFSFKFQFICLLTINRSNERSSSAQIQNADESNYIKCKVP